MLRAGQRGRSGVPGAITSHVFAMREISREFGFTKLRSQPREVRKAPAPRRCTRARVDSEAATSQRRLKLTTLVYHVQFSLFFRPLQPFSWRPPPVNNIRST